MSTQNRPVRICIVLEPKNPVRKVLEQVLQVVGEPTTHCFVEKQTEADLVVFGDVRAIEKGFSDSRSYAYLKGAADYADRDQQIPDSVARITPGTELASLLELIQKVSTELKPSEAVATVSEAEVALRTDAQSILVIEDTPKHQASARRLLAGHKLTVATGYEEAMEILAREKFDVVLTDLHMPMSSRTLGGEAFKLGELVPYGLFLMIEAARNRAKEVAVVTDLNHHADWVSAAFDHFGYVFYIDRTRVMMMHAPMTDDGCKDWAKALYRLTVEG